MTDKLDPALVRAREIYRDYLRAGSGNPDAGADVMRGECDNTHGVKLALAAIRETTEQAAKLVEKFRPRGPEAKRFVDILVCDITAALRRNWHLEDK
jgi:hypothetical protein